jgi:hypothetical protein
MALTETTLSTAITTPSGGNPASPVVVVASATGIVKSTTAIYVDRELMNVVGVNGTTITVMRGSGGTRAATHASGARVFVGTRNLFGTFPQAGSTTLANNPTDPLIDISTGIRYYAKNSVWVADPNFPQNDGAGGTGRFRFPTITFGSTAYGSVGTATSSVAGTVYFADVFVGRDFKATGIGILNAGTIGTNLGIVALYDSGGVLLANSALAGAVTVGANAFQQYAFTATVQVQGPAQYWIAYQANGATDNFRTIAASTFVDVLTKSQTGVFGTIPATFTPPTTFTADVGPAAYLY